MEVISTHNLVKQYGSTHAADNISIHVNKGEIYGFLGLNGAGKTTLIRMLLAMIQPDKGDIFLFGQKLDKKFQRWNEIGYLVETPHAYPDLTVLDNLRVFYKFRNLNKPNLIDEIISKLKLEKYRNSRAKVLSLGNQQRLGLAKALMHQPALLILDEPINGLDPEGIVEVRELLQELTQNGSTVLLSSHILGEISKVATRIGIIHEGRLIRELNTEELFSQLHKKLIIRTRNNNEAINYLYDAGYSAIKTADNSIEIKDPDAIQFPEKISRFLVEKDLPPVQLSTFTEDLEMYFLRTIQTSKSQIS
ncbi:MAG: ABC transporter ATP-binding protein [Saprospiraceae bacterium]|nr:ABC transporter ATP-binding protein [Saprospiraceae bacterium]